MNGHYAPITRVNVSSSFFVTGGLDGHLKVTYFGLFNSELKKSSAISKIKG